MSARDTPDFPRILGDALAKCWDGLSQEAQHRIFETAAGAPDTADDELFREQLAVFLHNHHSKTSEPTAMPQEVTPARP